MLIVTGDMPDRAFRLGPAKRNVFLMMRFQNSPEHAAISSTIVATLADYGLTAVRADWNTQHDELWSNVRECMDASDYGIAVFETVSGEALSPNVSLELGYMLAQGKRCLLLRESGVPMLPADLAGHICQAFDIGSARKTVEDAVRTWLRELGLAKRPGERLLVYMSYGGTCRDPMAKAITDLLLERRPPQFRVRVEAVAAGPTSEREASFAAREAIRQMYGRDLLADHVPTRITTQIEEEADLILVMTERLLNPKSPAISKTAVLKPFFGLVGDVEDPWPDGTDHQALRRYSNCCAELRQILEQNFEVLLDRLEAGTNADP